MEFGTLLHTMQSDRVYHEVYEYFGEARSYFVWERAWNLRNKGVASQRYERKCPLAENGVPALPLAEMSLLHLIQL